MLVNTTLPYAFDKYPPSQKEQTNSGILLKYVISSHLKTKI